MGKSKSSGKCVMHVSNLLLESSFFTTVLDFLLDSNQNKKIYIKNLLVTENKQRKGEKRKEKGKHQKHHT